jgi:hypothetical protein
MMDEESSENDIENVLGCVAGAGLILTIALLVAFYFIQFYR